MVASSQAFEPSMCVQRTTPSPGLGWGLLTRSAPRRGSSRRGLAARGEVRLLLEDHLAVGLAGIAEAQVQRGHSQNVPFDPSSGSDARGSPPGAVGSEERESESPKVFVLLTDSKRTGPPGALRAPRSPRAPSQPLPR